MKLTLSGELLRLAEGFSHREVRLSELIDVLQLRGYNALLLFLALPFITPVPLPGVSTPFGMLIALLGMRMAMARRPWVPESIRSRTLSPRFLPKLLLAGGRLFAKLENLLRPRWLYPVFPSVFQRASGLMIVACGLLLLLPLPVPLSNAFPALAIILLAAAGLERDGAMFIVGCIQFVLCLCFFGTLLAGGNEVWKWLSG